MKEVFKNIKERLETEKAELTTWAEDMAFKLGINKAIEIVNQVEEEYQTECNSSRLNNGWIPCSERLPERGTAVLVQDDENLMDIAIFKKEYGVDGFDLQDFWVSANNFIAWQPLPEPYKGY